MNKKRRATKLDYAERESISRTGVATCMVTIGYTLGATTWPGRLLIWPIPVAILFIPKMIARIFDRWDERSERKDYVNHRKELVSIYRQPGLSKEHKDDLRKEIEELDMNRAKRINEKAKRPPIRAKE